MFLRPDGRLLRTVAFGPGPHTVLALNGWSAAWEAWQPTFELLSTDTRCISFDTRGTGASQGEPSDITLTGLVDDVFRVLDGHGVERCVLAGESLGGFVALHAALRDPSRFEGLVLVASAPVVSPEVTGRLVAGARRDYPATIRLFVKMCLNEPEAAPLHPWGERLFLDTAPEVAARLFEACHGAEPALAALTLPTVVVHGSEDLVVPPAAGEALARGIPGARLVSLPGAGHAPTITRPEAVAEAIRSLRAPPR